MAFFTDMLDETRKLNAAAVNGTALRRPSLSQLAAGPAPVQTMDYSQKGPAMTVPQGAAPTDPDAPKPQAPSIFSNPNSVYAGWGGPAQAAAPRQPLPADRDPFAHPASLSAVAQQPAAPASAQQDSAFPGGMSRAPSSLAQAAGLVSAGAGGNPGTAGGAAPAPTDILTPGKTGNAAVASYVNNPGLVDRFNQQHADTGITLSMDANGRPVFSGGSAPSSGASAPTVGGLSSVASQGRTPMDIYRNASAIQGEINALQPHVGSIRSTSISDTIAPSMPSGLSPRQQAAFIGQQDTNRLGLARLAQEGDLGQQRLAQDASYQGGVLANQRGELGIKGQTLGLQGQEMQDRLATNDVTRQGSLADIAQKKFLSDLQQKALNDPTAAAQYRALTGKSESMPYEFGYASTKDASGNETKVPSMRLNKATGETSPIAGQQAPSYADFGAQIRAKNPGQTITDQQLQDAYKQQFGR